MKKGLIMAIIIAVLIVGIIIYALTGVKYAKLDSSTVPSDANSAGSETTNPNIPPMPPNPPSVKSIDISNFAFSPATLTINKGETVIWTNKDSAAHTVTSDSGSELNSETLSQGKTYARTFNTVGTYDYHCNFHGMMKATIIVK